MAFFDCGGVRLMLSLPETAEYDHPASIIYYKVDDIQGAAAVLAARQVGLRQRAASHREAAARGPVDGIPARRRRKSGRADERW